MSELFLCHLTDIQDGHARGFDPLETGKDSIFVLRRGDGVVGYLNACPHIPDTRLEWKKDAFLTHDRQHIFCSGHGAMFRLHDGVCVRGACLGQALTPVSLTIKAGLIFYHPNAALKPAHGPGN